jgi:hypothetical protein
MPYPLTKMVVLRIYDPLFRVLDGGVLSGWGMLAPQSFPTRLALCPHWLSESVGAFFSAGSNFTSKMVPPGA